MQLVLDNSSLNLVWAWWLRLRKQRKHKMWTQFFRVVYKTNLKDWNCDLKQFESQQYQPPARPHHYTRWNPRMTICVPKHTHGASLPWSHHTDSMTAPTISPRRPFHPQNDHCWFSHLVYSHLFITYSPSSSSPVWCWKFGVGGGLMNSSAQG